MRLAVCLLVMLAQPADDLFARLAKVEGLAADFEEKKVIGILQTPVTQKGRLFFHRDGLVYRESEKERMWLRDGTLILQHGKKKRVVDTSSSPVLRALSHVFLHVLRGDRAELKKNFEIAVTEKDGVWRLLLTARTKELKKAFKSIELTGKGDAASTMTITHGNGDVTTSKFSNVDTSRKFTEAEKMRIFVP